MPAELLHYASRLDDKDQPLPVCATDDGTEPKALILDVSPGAIANLEGSVKQCGNLAAGARDLGVECVIAKPCGRGPGSVYQGPGEVDFFEAVEALRDKFPIDPNRISVTGGSMGGASTWFLASHYPDRFAAAAPFCGYCDYRLWTKPGGYIMRMMPWEEHSWVARGATFRVGNLRNTALRITHGAWDIGIGGGVPVEHSRSMSRKLTDEGIPHQYDEVPETGHGCSPPERLIPTIQWMSEQTRVTDPEAITLTVHGLRHNRTHWVAVDQIDRHGEAAEVNAKIDAGRVVVTTSNATRVALGPTAHATTGMVEIDGTAIDADVSARLVNFEKTGGTWGVTGSAALAGSKRHGCSGPVGDVFLEPMRLAFGSQGSNHDTFLMQWMSNQLPGSFKQTNGGVHRGIFAGQSWYDIPNSADHQLGPADVESCNLWLLGTYESNSVLKQFEGKLPLEFGEGSITLGGRRYEGKQLGISACFPSPANPERLLVVTAGLTPEAVTGATHLNMQLLPDYLIWDADEVIDFGFYDSNWSLA
ncbi:MAG TPA: prolyl oligopeptidase family serine peptidase [Armatimonadota bacterium]|nr:prolyl oligopeptidase family serine peptidase [Armatimonadota bacterium]